MSYQVLARKWRPKRFSELVGQEHVVRALVNALDGKRLHHAFLFTGTRGVGKTTIARILAKSLNCETGVSSEPCGRCAACLDIDAGRYVDLLEIDAASKTKVDDTREMLDNVVYAPARGAFKVYLIDEVHMLSTHSFNALLKTLEEPPAHVKFLLATTDPQKLPVTVLSRCLQFALRRLTPEQIGGQLRHILTQEQISFDSAAVDQLAIAADGSLRDGLSLLDQALAFGGGALRDAEVRAMLGTLEHGTVRELLEAVVAEDAAGVLARVQQLDLYAVDFGRIVEDLARLLHRVAVAQVAPAAESDAEVRALANRMAAEQVQLCYQMAILGARDFALAPSPRIGLEMLLLRMLAFRPAGAEAPAGGSAPASGSARLQRGSTAPVGAKASAGPAAIEVPSPASPEPAEAVAAVRANRAASEPALAPEREVPAMDLPDCAWERLVLRLDLRGLARELAMNLVALEREPDRWCLGLGVEHEHLDTPANRKALERALSEAGLGSMRLELRRLPVGIDAPASPAQRQRRREAQRALEARDRIDNDPIVQSLVRSFDARIVPGSIHPEEETPR